MPRLSDQELAAVIMPGGTIRMEWEVSEAPADKSVKKLEKEIYKRFTGDSEPWLLYLGFCDPKVSLSTSLNYWKSFAGTFVHRLIQTPDLESLGDRVRIPVSDEELAAFVDRAPPMTGSEYLDCSLLRDLWESLNTDFANAVDSFDGNVDAFVRSCNPSLHLAGRVYFHLVENKEADAPFAFLATYTAGLNENGESRHLPLKHALQEYENHPQKLLELLVTVHSAAGKSRLVNELIESGELFHPLRWSAEEAFTFLQEIPLYEECGILCRIPNWWKGRASSASVGIRIGNAKPAMVGMDALLDFEPKLYLGDVEVSEGEARRLLNESRGLAMIKNKWVAIDDRKLEQALEAYQKAKRLMSSGGMSLLDAMRLQLNPHSLQGENDVDRIAGVSNGQWLSSVFESLRHPERIRKTSPGRYLHAQLRPYQEKGLDWLAYLNDLRLGACLADDMGLGKTVQLLAFLAVLKNRSKGKKNATLLIVPASLISNWQNEIERFTSGLRVFVAHPEMHKPGGIPELNEEALKNLDLVITTYAMVQKLEWLHACHWHYIVLDEAQAIKNPGTKQTRAVKKLTCENRIAMTGTPIENRLSDLWSLFDFINPGLLGSPGEFQSFVKQLKDDADGYARLRKITAPFILRRLKTDRNVISDLPEKVELKNWVLPETKQVLLYEELVDHLKKTLESSDGIQRKGMILSALTRFKQLCNHPDQYLGTGSFAEKDSGKFLRLREICETIREKRERVLVFTQFKEMTDPLKRFLEHLFQRKGEILHGSVPVGRRKTIIERFQGSDYIPFMVLSLKAGGVGLNLTAANHVIHFDRWWNPAVENQATDRAFRIGQDKTVMVHKLITKGTIEEKIDGMLESKSALADDVIQSAGETWITEMPDNELLDLFRLS